MLRAFFALLLSTTLSHAAQFEVIAPEGNPPDDQKIIFIYGSIEIGDYQAFEAIASELPEAIVALQSPGGYVEEALAIGAQINIKGYSTYVAEGFECYSACALIWLAGSSRYMTDTSTIGVHAAFYEDEYGRQTVSGAANADIGAYLSLLGLRREAIRYITAAEPGEGFLYITPMLANELGIEVILEEEQEAEPADPLTPLAQIAHDAIGLSLFEETCSSVFRIDTVAKASARSLLRQALVDHDRKSMHDHLSDAVNFMRASIDTLGSATWCLHAGVGYQSRGFDIGIYEPGFDCLYAKTQNERLICSTPRLWAFDRALSVLYADKYKGSSHPKQARLKSSQITWLNQRNSCRGDMACTENAYQARISNITSEHY